MELYIPQERAVCNAKTGQFLQGSTPHNKGSHWSDYMGKRAQKRAARGWQNRKIKIEEARPKGQRCIMYEG